jgi:hypothetical protein
MRSIKSRFKILQERNPNLGDYLLLAMAVEGKNFTRKQILENFNTLVQKDEYEEADKYSLITNLHTLSKTLVDRQIGTKNGPGEIENPEDESVLTKKEKVGLKDKRSINSTNNNK